MERQETARQRDIRLRREAREREREERARNKEAERQRKLDRKRRLNIALERFKIINGVKTNYISRVKKWYERRGINLTTEETENRLLRDYMPPPLPPAPPARIYEVDEQGNIDNLEDDDDTDYFVNYEGIKREFRIKDYSGKFRKLDIHLFLVNCKIIYSTDNLPLIIDLVNLLLEHLPDGYQFGLSLWGSMFLLGHRQQYKKILSTRITSNIEQCITEIVECKKIDVSSEHFYRIEQIQLFYEAEQGQGINNKVKINIADLKLKYSIYSPTTAKNCGMMCLLKYNIMSRKGAMSLTDIKAYNPPIPVLDKIEDAGNAEEFILLRDGHYIICTIKAKKQADKIKERIKTLTTEDYKNAQLIKNRANKKKKNTDEYKQKRIEKQEKRQESIKKRQERYNELSKTEEGRKQIEQERLLKIEFKRTDIYKLNKEVKAVKKSNKFKPLVFDIESYNRQEDIIKKGKLTSKIYQIPAIIGTSERPKGDQDLINFNYFEGLDCVEKFIAMLKDSDYTHLIGYNNGGYDHHLIKNEIIKQGGSLTEYLKSASKLMRGEIKFTVINKVSEDLKHLPFYEEGEEIKEIKTIHIIDLMNYTTGSLKNNLLSYNCKTAKGEIDYDKIYEWGSMEQGFKIDLIEYLKNDCIGTYELYDKLREPYLKWGINMLDCFTASQASTKILNYFWSIGDFSHKIKGQRETADLNRFRASANGGRCEVFKKIYRSQLYELIQQRKLTYDEISDYMRALDVNSLYPSVMRNNRYPIGNHIFTTIYQQDKLGIYKCLVKKPNNLKYPVVYDKQHKSYNLFENDKEQYYTSIDIEQMRKYGYIVNIIDGHYWKETDYIFKEYIDEFYKVKQTATKGSPQYENAKLMLNAIYGKMLQGDIHETAYTVATKEELLEVKKSIAYKTGSLSGTADIENGTFNYIFTEGAGEFSRKTPHLGAFILSYSKIPVYEKFKDCEPYYTDTDSIYCEAKYGHLFDIGDELGQWSDDLKGKIIYGSFMAKKLKMVQVVEPNYIYKVDTNGIPLLDKKGKKIIDKDEQGNEKYINDNKYVIKEEYTGKGCNIKDLTKSDFKQLEQGKAIENKRAFKMIRDLQKGTIEYYKNDIKIIKMNDGNRHFNNNESLPLGHIDITATSETIHLKNSFMGLSALYN